MDRACAQAETERGAGVGGLGKGRHGRVQSFGAEQARRYRLATSNPVPRHTNAQRAYKKCNGLIGLIGLIGADPADPADRADPADPADRADRHKNVTAGLRD